ncbi:MAG: XdhC family protein [Parvibaculum sp.]
MKLSVLTELQAHRTAKRVCVLATQLETGDQTLLVDPANGPDWLVNAAAQAAKTDKSQTIVSEEGTAWFLNVFNPPLRLAIIGAVHIAQPLSRMAQEAGFDVTIVDPREAFADPARFPGATILSDWPDEALRQFSPDARSAIVTLTHDPKLDDPGLHIALTSDAFYIGALGSKKTQASRVERLKDAKCSDSQIARIHGPVGLNIGAKSPAEISISILAEIVATLRQ